MVSLSQLYVIVTLLLDVPFGKSCFVWMEHFSILVPIIILKWMDKVRLLIKLWRCRFDVLWVPNQKNGLSVCIGLNIAIILVGNLLYERLLLKLYMEKPFTTNWLYSKNCKIGSYWTWIDFLGSSSQRSPRMYCPSSSSKKKVVWF